MLCGRYIDFFEYYMLCICVPQQHGTTERLFNTLTGCLIRYASLIRLGQYGE